MKTRDKCQRLDWRQRARAVDLDVKRRWSIVNGDIRQDVGSGAVDGNYCLILY